jgi:hypothetical protein
MEKLRDEILAVGRALDGEVGGLRAEAKDTRTKLRYVQQDIEELMRRQDEIDQRKERRETETKRPERGAKNPDLRQALLLLADLVTVLGG